MTTTVAKVISKFTKTISELDKISNLNRNTADRKNEQIVDLEVEIDSCMEEAVKAEKIKKKFEELLAI